ncbi:MAG: NAD+ synthase [bacterium]
MSDQIRLALAQINTTVGDLEGNTEKIIHYIQKAKKAGADMVLFPELSIPGYPPEDLLLKSKFIDDNVSFLDLIMEQTQDIMVIAGFVQKKEQIFNTAGVFYQKRLAAFYHKICLPNYSVFDEKRYFQPGKRPLVFEWNGIKFGLSICEDMWVPDGVIESQAFLGGAEIILNISASPYIMDKQKERLSIGMSRARVTRTLLVYLNLIGGQDELIFDGDSFIVNHRGDILLQTKQFEEDFVVADLDVSKLRDFRKSDPSFNLFKKEFKAPYQINFVAVEGNCDNSPKAPIKHKPVQALGLMEQIYRALLLGTKDYVTKNGFSKVVIGLSGGIDSALTTMIAVDALGADNVVGVLMPSEFTSEQSLRDARKLATNLRIRTETIPIHGTLSCYLEVLSDVFKECQRDVTEENLQARIRGNFLMALSNKFGWLVLTTGNKSETSVGYCTLYGDMAGGFAVIKDVPKTLVYKLCKHRNQKEGTAIIPESILTKAPTAELRADQKDQDSLPSYDLLDAILEEFVEKDKSVKEIIQQGFPREIVKNVACMVDRNEYKRRQAPPGIKITQKAFGKDRRMPITNCYSLGR